MRTELGDLLRQERLRRGLTLQDLARHIGYRNVNRGARRLERLERTGREVKEFVKTVAASLDAGAQVPELLARDEQARHEAFQVWLAEPQEMELLQMACGVTLGVPLPAGLSEKEAIGRALAVREKTGLRTCLVLDRRRSLWIASDGRAGIIETTPDSLNFPYTTLG